MSILFFAFAFIYFVFLCLVMHYSSKYIKNKRALFLPVIFIVLLLIPTWDYILGKQVFEGYCKKEAGLHIYEDIQKVDSIYVESSTPYYYLDSGYEFVEEKEDDKYYKYYFNKNHINCIKKNTYWLKNRECISKIKISKPISLYKLIYSSSSKKLSKVFNINQRTSVILYKLNTNKKVAEIINYHWDMGWFFKMAGFFRGTQCTSKLDTYNELRLKIIKDKR